MGLIDYTRINWANGETGGTPLSASNLNNMDAALYQMDQALAGLTVSSSGAWTLGVGLTTSSTVCVANNTGYYAQNAAGANCRALYMSTSDVLTLGSSSYATQINGSAITLSGAVTATGSGYFAGGLGVANGSGTGYSARNASGSDVDVLGMTSGNMVYLGNSSYATRIIGSAITSSSSITVSSDARLKEDFGDLGEAHDALFDGLQPLTYRYKGKAGRHIGMTVQDTEAAMRAAELDPAEYALTTWAPDPETGETYGALAYDELIGLLVQQVQALKARVAALERGDNHD